VIMACRDEARCQTATSLLIQAVPTAIVEQMTLDLADLDSVRTFAATLSARHETLDILMNNAGVMATPERLTTAQGFELQFGTNHLGHFALTGLLVPLLIRTSESRIVTVSSFAHEAGLIDFDDLQHEHGYTPYGAYSASKLANLLFMLELDRRLRLAKAASLSVGAHPGFASTNLQASGPFLGAAPMTSRLVLAGGRLSRQSAEKGAEAQLYAATAGGVEGGDYFGPKYRLGGPIARSGMSPRARDETAASRLWDVSKRLTGVDIDTAIAARL
jgi:NAD(P)-dependent dehydrogenase (short-subunit alcohol dehydrogenase family)